MDLSYIMRLVDKYGAPTKHHHSFWHNPCKTPLRAAFLVALLNVGTFLTALWVTCR